MQSWIKVVQWDCYTFIDSGNVTKCTPQDVNILIWCDCTLEPYDVDLLMKRFSDNDDGMMRSIDFLNPKRNKKKITHESYCSICQISCFCVIAQVSAVLVLTDSSFHMMSINCQQIWLNSVWPGLLIGCNWVCEATMMCSFHSKEIVGFLMQEKTFACRIASRKEVVCRSKRGQSNRTFYQCSNINTNLNLNALNKKNVVSLVENWH